MWINDIYIYRIGTLKAIALGYEFLYSDAHTESLYEIALLKADFDRSLDSIGRGNWTGEVLEFNFYKYFGKQQRIIIADIIGISDRELKGLGFYNIPQLRHEAYKRMVNILNGG